MPQNTGSNRFSANCRPILIGSLPITDHQKAMRLVVDKCPDIPLWPQLPKMAREGMVRQFLTGFPGLKDQADKYLVEDQSETFTEEMAAFYEDYMAIETGHDQLQDSRFSLGMDSAPGFFTLIDFIDAEKPDFYTLKGQITGPVTTGIGVKDSNGKSIFYNDNLRDMLIKHLGMKGLWQVKILKERTGGRNPIVFIDEPGLVSFGSSGFTGVTRELAIESVEEVISIVKSGGSIVGIHICANGDWGPSLTSCADIISFDAYFYFDNFILYRQQLLEFLQRGGMLAWGIVPTGDPEVVAKESTQSLFAKWQSQLHAMANLGFDEHQLAKQTFIAPSCGTGSLTPELAEKVLSMTGELSHLIRDQLLRRSFLGSGQ